MENPLANWAIYNGISDANAFPNPNDALTSIYVPVQDLFMQGLPLIQCSDA